MKDEEDSVQRIEWKVSKYEGQANGQGKNVTDIGITTLHTMKSKCTTSKHCVAMSQKRKIS